MRRTAVVFAFFLISGCASVQLTRVPTTLELMRILDVHIWWLPYDANWTIEVADAQPLGTRTAGLLHAGRESVVSIRPMAEGRYAFTVDDRRGTLNFLDGQQVRFFHSPKCNADCSAYIAGEVGGRQIVITSSRSSASSPRP